MGLDVLSPTQVAEHTMLRAAGVLQTLEGHYLSTHQQTYICFCGDGKHALDLTTFHAALCGIDHKLEEALFHKIALNGGALVISPSNPLANLRGLPQDLVSLMNIEYALKLKGNHGQVALYIHAPCGAAKEAGISSLVDIIDHGLRAKLRVRQVFPESVFDGSVRCYFHACKDGDGAIDRNTYFVSKDKWEEWLTLPENAPRLASWDAYKARISKNPGWVPEELVLDLKKKGLL